MKKLVIFLITLISIVMIGCSDNTTNNSPVELEFWTTTADEETNALGQLIDKFHETHPNIHVEMVEVDFNSALNQFKANTLAGNPPDILRSDIGWTTELADLGVLLTLDDKVANEDIDDYIQSAFLYNTYEDHIYGIPMVTDSPALLYNKNILKEAGYNEAPATINELMEISKEITNEDQYGIYINNDSYYALPFIWGFGGGMISDNNEIEIANEGSIEGINFMKELFVEEIAQPTTDFSDAYGTMMNDFKEGKAAMIINGPWATTDVMSGSEFQDPSNLGIAPFPEGPGGQGSPTGGHNFVLSSYTEFPDEAYDFINYLNSTESQLMMAKEIGTLPTRESAYLDEELMQDPIFQGFKAQLDVAQSRPIIPEGSLLFGDFTTSLSEILTDEISTEEGLREVEDSWEYLIE